MILRFFSSALVVGVGRCFTYKAPLGGPSDPGFLVVGVVLGVSLLTVSSLPEDVALY